MPQWLSRISSGGKPVWTRSLSLTEQKWFWWTKCDGTSDLMEHIEVVVDAADLLITERVKNAWSKVKLRYPLLGCRVEQKGNDGIPFIEVEKERLYNLLPGEVELSTISSELGVETYIDHFLNGPRRLSDQLLACLSIVSVRGNSQAAKKFHIFIMFSHLIGDGVAGLTIAKAFFESLTSTSGSPGLIEDSYITQRLQMVPGLAVTGRNCARRRWRKAIAWAILRVRGRSMTVSEN